MQTHMAFIIEGKITKKSSEGRAERLAAMRAKWRAQALAEDQETKE